MRLGADARADYESCFGASGYPRRSWSCWLANTSTAELLSRCLSGDSWSDELLRASLAEEMDARSSV